MTLLKGNCLETLKTLDTASVDSIVTDPPYELGFMGKSWDNSGIAYNQDLWAECLRVLKPGGHLLAFSGSRTYHRMVVAIEDSGFEIRDQIMWLYGSGFPKSLNVSKAIDKKAGAPVKVGKRFTVAGGIEAQPTPQGEAREEMRHNAITPEAQQWQGWGTALKPAHEPIVVARKPLGGTVANNVLTYGTGAINIDGSRVGTDGGCAGAGAGAGARVFGNGLNGTFAKPVEGLGRWPANVIHDGSDEVLEGFPDTAPSRQGKPRGTAKKGLFANSEFNKVGTEHNDNGGSAARFFYCAKASKSERNAGLEESNTHPTVKPLALMRYLVRLVCPPNGVVLDPFLGSGTTAVAATLEGFEWIGCEMTEDYFSIIEARVEWALNQPKPMV